MDSKFMQKTGVVCLGAMTSCFLWGSAFPCIKLGLSMMQIQTEDIWSQILYAGYRFTLAGLLVILFGSLIQRKWLVPSVKAVPKVFELSLFQTILQYVFFYIGLARTLGTKASIIEGMNVFVAILIASLIFRQEKLTRQKMLGCLIGFIGVVLVNMTGQSMDFSMSFFGEGFIFLSTISYAFSSVLIKKLSLEENPVMLSGWQFLIGGIFMAALGLSLGGNVSGFTTKSLLMLFYLSFISAGAYSVWSILLTYNPISKVAVFGFMNPVFGFILSSVLLHENSTSGLKAILALLLVCLGIYIVNRAPKENEKNKNLL